MMNFEAGKTYKDRAGNTYIYVKKSGNVTIFRDETKEVARHSSGRYRWDEQDTEKDIVQ
jgi:hypothetical protein